MTALWANLQPHWLQQLGLIEAPEGTVLHAATVSLRGLLPWWLALLIVVVAGTVAWMLYRRENPPPRGLRLGLFVLLRSSLVALLLALLLRPVLLAEFRGERSRSVVLLVDSSQSMETADRRVSDADRLRVAIARGLLPANHSLGDVAALARLSAEQLANAPRIELVRSVFAQDRLGLLAGLRQRGPVQVQLFDRRLTSVTSDSEQLADALRADGAQTALADSLVEVLAQQAGELPTALVVVTDGRDNASKRTLEEAAQLCRDRGVPLHIWGVGSSEAGVLQIKDVQVPPTVFVDEKTSVEDDLVEIPVRFRARGYKKGTAVLTVELGDVSVTERFAIQEGENLTRTVRIRPRKGPEGQRPVRIRLSLEGVPDLSDEVQKTTQVKTSRVKVLYVENKPRREYRFIQPVLDRDRRVLARLCLLEGDPRLSENPPDKESGAMFLPRFPENFPEPDPRDPDRRPYDLLLLGDVPYSALGEKGTRAIRQFVKEGGGLVLLAGPHHAPSEYVNSPLYEVLPVEFTSQAFTPDDMARLTPFRPLLTYDGEQSNVLALDDDQQQSLKLWKDELWKHSPGFFWYYPVQDLRPGATALLVHPDRKTTRKPDIKPMPLFATQYYGKGEVLFLGTDETWRWRDSTGDRLTARFWGQVVARFGLPHLLGNARRSQIDLERGEAILGRPGTFKVRLLDSKYEPVVRPTVQATLVNLDSKDEATRSRTVTLRRVAGQPGEYRGSLPNDAPGRHEIRLAESDGLEAATLNYRVELPPRHELEEVGLAEEALRSAAAVSGGQFYREEDLHRLPQAIESRTAPFVLRQEVLLWSVLPLVLFVLLISAEWLLRKFSNLS